MIKFLLFLILFRRVSSLHEATLSQYQLLLATSQVKMEAARNELKSAHNDLDKKRAELNKAHTENNKAKISLELQISQLEKKVSLYEERKKLQNIATRELETVKSVLFSQFEEQVQKNLVDSKDGNGDEDDDKDGDKTVITFKKDKQNDDHPHSLRRARSQFLLQNQVQSKAAQIFSSRHLGQLNMKAQKLPEKKIFGLFGSGGPVGSAGSDDGEDNEKGGENKKNNSKTKPKPNAKKLKEMANLSVVGSQLEAKEKELEKEREKEKEEKRKKEKEKEEEETTGDELAVLAFATSKQNEKERQRIDNINNAIAKHRGVRMLAAPDGFMSYLKTQFPVAGALSAWYGLIIVGLDLVEDFQSAECNPVIFGCRILVAIAFFGLYMKLKYDIIKNDKQLTEFGNKLQNSTKDEKDESQSSKPLRLSDIEVKVKWKDLKINNVDYGILFCFLGSFVVDARWIACVINFDQGADHEREEALVKTGAMVLMIIFLIYCFHQNDSKIAAEEFDLEIETMLGGMGVSEHPNMKQHSSAGINRDQHDQFRRANTQMIGAGSLSVNPYSP